MSTAQLLPSRPRSSVREATSLPEAWVSIESAAAHLGVKVSWLYAQGDRLGVPCRRLNRLRRYRLSELDAYMQRAQ